MRSQKKLAVPQRQFRMAAKKVARTEQTEEARPQQQQPDVDRYLLQKDRQTKRSFKNSRSCAICGTRDQRPLRQTWPRKPADMQGRGSCCRLQVHPKRLRP